VTSVRAGIAIVPAALDSAPVLALIERVQQEYVVRYGGPDDTVLAPAEFTPPAGLFLLGTADGVPVACGGWRARDGGEPGLRDGDAELKRMYVAPAARGRGLARAVLAELERSAAAAGRTRMVLETGTEQPEAIGLYTSAGYAPIEKFGLYRCAAESRCYGKYLEES
jgi:GNAT superfamily N-acetyltransferase